MKNLIITLVCLVIFCYANVCAQCDEVTVPAYEHWTNTGYTVAVDDLLSINAEGEWRMGVGGVCGPEGETNIADHGDYPLFGVPVGALLGRIGVSGTIFLVGSNYCGQATEAGTLYLGPNEGQTWWGNESGELCATISDICDDCCGLYTGGFTGNTNCDSGGLRDLADITRLIDNVYISKDALCCPENGNVNGDAGGLINLADITRLIDHVYISKVETAVCASATIGTLISHSTCKSNSLAQEVNNYATDQDCIEWQYDGSSELLITHVNAGLNCCPIILAYINIESMTITVTEIDSLDNGGCKCLCLFDIEYRITNLTPGQYHLIFVEPYKHESDPVLDITIDLIATPIGAHCVSRAYYPWGY